MNHFGYAALVDALLPKLKSQVRARFLDNDQCHVHVNLMHEGSELARSLAAARPRARPCLAPSKSVDSVTSCQVCPRLLSARGADERAPAQAHPSRVVLFGSIGHRLQRRPLPLDDLHFRHRWYQRFLGYGQSKFAAILFASELSRRCDPHEHTAVVDVSLRAGTCT